MQQSLFPAWQTQEYRDMLEWMRAYNTSPTHTTKIHFFGMDIQKASQGDFDTVYTYVHMVDPQQTALVQQLYSQSPGPAGLRPAACSPASIRKPPIATSLYQGVYNIHPGGSYPVPTALPGTPGKDTYNYTLGNVSIPLYLLDLRKTPPGPVTDWANGPHIFLEYGISGEYLSIPGSLQQWFDLIVFIRHTTASRSLLYL